MWKGHCTFVEGESVLLQGRETYHDPLYEVWVILRKMECTSLSSSLPYEDSVVDLEMRWVCITKPAQVRMKHLIIRIASLSGLPAGGYSSFGMRGCGLANPESLCIEILNVVVEAVLDSNRQQFA